MFRIGKRRHKVRAFIQDGPTVEGVLVAVTSIHYVLMAPALVQDGDDTVALDGPVEIPREKVSFFQVIA